MRKTGQAVEIEVVDSGIGIAAEHLDRVFDEYSQIDDAYSRSQEGTGLGLSIAQAIVKSHGGTIRAANIDGGGTTVTIELPAL